MSGALAGRPLLGLICVVQAECFHGLLREAGELVEVGPLTKKQIAKRIALELGISQALALRMVQRTLDSVVDAIVDNGRIELRNFGVFEIKARAARQARNPRTNEPVTIPPRHAVTFQPSKKLAELVNEARPLPAGFGNVSAEA